MSSYKDYKKRVLQNPEIKSKYNALQPEYDIIQTMIDVKAQQNMIQKDLSAKTGITQADISRIENGTRNPDPDPEQIVCVLGDEEPEFTKESPTFRRFQL